MPKITLSWQQPFASNIEQYGTNNWIYQVTWRKTTSNVLMPKLPGIYVIEDPVGHQLYVGKTTSWRGRFNGRTEVLREFRLSTQTGSPVDDYAVRVASTNPRAQRGTAEEWLIRILYLAQNADSSLILQNKKSAKQFKVPAGGLSITNGGFTPDYLEASYTYQANTLI
jgi:hypothetical protein